MVVIKILRASKGTLSRWFQLQLQSLALNLFQSRNAVQQVASLKNKLVNFDHNMVKTYTDPT
jgi:hypothetical protein